MTRLRTWCGILASGMLVASVPLHAGSAAGQSATLVQSGSPTYAIPLKDGNTAVVWWDAVSDPVHPVWRCEVPTPRGADAGRTITALTAGPGDWRAALAEARAALTGRVADGE
jgi:hypothetical protein